MTHAGLPVLARHHLMNPTLGDELVFSAFLDQPLIIYGHHSDLADGYDSLAEHSSWLRRLGAVSWMSISEIARSNVWIRGEPTAPLRVRMFSRNARLRVPRDIDALTVELPRSYDGAELEAVGGDVPPHRFELTSPVARTEPLPVVPGSILDLRLVRDMEPMIVERRLRAHRMQPHLRRVATEARDRLQPTIRKARLTRAFDLVQAVVHGLRR